MGGYASVPIGTSCKSTLHYCPNVLVFFDTGLVFSRLSIGQWGLSGGIPKGIIGAEAKLTPREILKQACLSK